MAILSVLNIGVSSLTSQRLALDVISENIANVNTPGYSRQTTLLETSATSIERGFPLGTGVKVGSIQRAYDDYLQRQLTTQNSTNGQSDAQLASMNRVQQLFSDLTSDGLGKSMENYFKSWQDLATNPQGQPERQAVLTRAQQVVDDFHRISSSLSDVKRDANQSLEGLVSDINTMTSRIASLNQQIKDVKIQSGTPNELMDQRDLLIRNLSEKVGITYLAQDDGTVNVSLTLGQPLVDGNRAAVLSLEADPGNSGFYKVLTTSPGGNDPIDISSIVGGPGNSQGEMGGALLVRETLVNGFMARLDEMAYTFATEVNSVHTKGYGLNGTTGLNFFSAPAAQAGYSGPGGIACSIASANDIATAGSDPAIGGTGNNTSALTMASVSDKLLAMSTGTTTLSGFYDSLLGNVGVAVQNAQRSSDQSNGILKQLDNLRESTSGVSLDEELASLIKYQKAYEGAAKLITTGTEMLDTLLGMIR